MHKNLSIAILITLAAAALCFAADEDPYLWLEEVEGERALAWAKEKSAADTAVLDPFTDDATVNLRCDILEPTTMEGYERDPRSVAKRARRISISVERPPRPGSVMSAARRAARQRRSPATIM